MVREQVDEKGPNMGQRYLASVENFSKPKFGVGREAIISFADFQTNMTYPEILI